MFQGRIQKNDADVEAQILKGSPNKQNQAPFY